MAIQGTQAVLGDQNSSVESGTANQEPIAPERAPALSHSVTLLFSVACGLAVANVYCAQPLLDAIAAEFRMRQASVGFVITMTQVGYALGLLLVVPLGDLLDRRKLIVSQLLLSVLALIVVGIASNSAVLLIGVFVIGLLAVVVQVLVAFAATLAAPTERGRVVGTVTSGVVLGILLARGVAGVLTDLAGWRSVYLVSSALMLLLAGALFRELPHDENAKAPSSYFQLLHSVFMLFIHEPLLRIRAVFALLIFAAFSALWTSLVLPLSTPPLSLSHTAIGSFGFVGVAGAFAAGRAGRWSDEGRAHRTTGVGLALLLMSWLPIAYLAHSLWALVVGIVALDFAVQAIHVTNQSMIFTARPEARSRLVAAYMIFYSIGSGTGSIASTFVYAYAGWGGVCMLGAGISGFALIFWILTIRYTPIRRKSLMYRPG